MEKGFADSGTMKKYLGLRKRHKLKPKELEMERQVVNPEERGLDDVGERGTSILNNFSPDVRACR